MKDVGGSGKIRQNKVTGCRKMSGGGGGIKQKKEETEQDACLMA